MLKRFGVRIQRKWKGILNCFLHVFIWLGVLATVASVIMIVVIIAKASKEYELQLTLSGFQNLTIFWSDYTLVLELFISAVTLAITGYTLKHALDIATINSLRELRKLFNTPEKKALHLHLMNHHESQLSFNSADILDYLGTIELANIMLSHRLLTLEQFYNQFGYRLEYLIQNSKIYRHVYIEAKDYYEDLHSVIRRLKKAELLKIDHPVIDTRVYKYYSNQQHNIDAFRDNQIFFSRPSRLNDPFDSSSRLIEPYKKFCKVIGWKPEMAASMDNHGICSFSESELPDNRHLWTLYADACRGYVLEFDRDMLIEKLPQQYRIPVYLQKVVYGYEPLNLDRLDSKIRLNDEEYTLMKCIQDGQKGLERVFQYLHLYKDYEVWHLENESRLIVGNLKSDRFKRIGESGYLLTLPMNTIKSLTIGSEMEKEQQEVLLTIAKQKNLPVNIATPEIVDNKWIVSIRKYTKV